MSNENSTLGQTLDQIIANEKAQETKTADKGKPTADKGKPTADKGKPTADKGKPTADKGKPTADKGKPTADKGKPTAPKLGKVYGYPGKIEGDCIRVYTYAILTALVNMAVGKAFRIADFRQFWASPTAYTYLSSKGVFEPGNAPGTITLTKTGAEFVKGRVIPKYTAQCETMVAYVKDGKALSESLKVNTGAFYKDVKPQEMSYTPMG